MSDCGSNREAGSLGFQLFQLLARKMGDDGDAFVDCEDRDCCAIRRDCAPSTYCGMRDAGP